MSIEVERLVNDTPPTPEQLHKLASVGVSSAVSRERLKTLRDKTAHFFVDELDLLTDLPQQEDEPTQIRHRIAARISATPAHDGIEKTWSLKYFNTYFIESTPGVWLGERSTYRFEWTRSKVLLAERSLRILGFGDSYSDTVEGTLENFRLSDDSVALLHASEQLRAVTDADCEQLISELSEYFTTVTTISGT